MLRNLIAVTFCLLVSTVQINASISSVYVAQTAQGANTGASCTAAFGSSFFNISGNWGSGSSQIGPGTTVYVCGTWTGGNGVNLLQFQGSGANGTPISLVFASGASLQPNYCSANGCIDLNGQSYIVIDGGATCGETTHWSTTPCNGVIENAIAGSTGATCLGGACSSLSGSVSSTGISNSTGSPTNIEIRNLHIHMYTRLAADTSDSGMATAAIGMGLGALPQAFSVHNMMLDGFGKALVLSLGTSSGTVSGYQMYNSNISDQCWAMGIGTDSPTMNVTGLLFYNNEVSNWDNWAPANTTGNVCHPNGTMWFNGDGGTVHTGNGFIGTSNSSIYGNYLHGNLAGNAPGTSPSGYISCQDNCINISVFNNIVIDTSTATDGGGAIYFNGPGGGGQQVYNNTIVRPCCSMIVVSGVTSNVVINNNILECTTTSCAAIEVRPNTPGAVSSNYNDGYQIGPGSWMIYNSQSSGSFISLLVERLTYALDMNSVTTNPLLDASYRPQAGSGAIGLGVNLTGLGIPGLNVDIAGNSRPATGSWTAGAYQFASSGLNPPTSLITSAQ
jgi:hypothetical protein